MYRTGSSARKRATSYLIWDILNSFLLAESGVERRTQLFNVFFRFILTCYEVYVQFVKFCCLL
jgi:hypothetical protein